VGLKAGFDAEARGKIQGRIKEFVGPRHFSSLGSFEDSKSTVGTIVYSRLYVLMKGDGMNG
jgi:hypothetical protein